MTNLTITKQLTSIGKKEIDFLVKEISKIVANDHYTIMEFCGTHTHEISRYGIRSLLPKNLSLKSGPGCPVCVTSEEDIDYIISITEKYDLGVITFGDIVRVPGSKGSLGYLKAKGKEVWVVYGPLESIKIAENNPNKDYILIGIGFETTVPTLAYTIKKIMDKGLKNIFYFSLHKLTPPAMKALLDSGEIKLDGIIGPGHVSTIVGVKGWQEVLKDYKIPFVIMGFEPEDVIFGIYVLLQKIKNKEYGVFNTYGRSVSFEGNFRAQELVNEIFMVSPANWRGFGIIPQSGMELREKYSYLDAKKRFVLDEPIKIRKTGCKCGEVLRGMIEPYECPLFAKVCTPDNPKGPCMVSSEGSCAAYYMYERN
ncbi:MAG: hydrogenase formation protein HypD [bacterium]